MAQTPHAASIALRKQLSGRIAAESLDFTPTDEASILEYFGEGVYIVKGNNLNDKLTTPEDFEIFASRAR
jgi:2-C-methyl-D-erythritol 4-phosphate cytidylyltransferase